MATHSNVLAWRIPWTEEPGGLQSTGHRESDTPERLNTAQHRNTLQRGLTLPLRCTKATKQVNILQPMLIATKELFKPEYVCTFSSLMESSIY